MAGNQMPKFDNDSPDRVRANSSETINRELDEEAELRIRGLAGKSREEMTNRIGELNREWDMERVLQTNASILALTGVFLGVTASRKFLFLPGVVFGFLVQHAVQGWCPPMPLFRHWKVRTRKEINREKYALKALGGDFDAVTPPNL